MSKASEWAEKVIKAKEDIKICDEAPEINVAGITAKAYVSTASLLCILVEDERMTVEELLTFCRWGLDTFGEGEDEGERSVVAGEEEARTIHICAKCMDQDEVWVPTKPAPTLDFSKAVKVWIKSSDISWLAERDKRTSGIVRDHKEFDEDIPVLVVPIKEQGR